MAIIPKIGRKSFKLRFAICSIYVALIAGSVTMIYPFLIMLSGSVKGSADIEKMDPVPQVLYSRQVQFGRFQEARYGDLTNLSSAYGRELLKETDADIPVVDKNELVTYRKFLKENLGKFPDHFYVIQDTISLPNVFPKNFRLYKNQIRKECSGSVDVYNKKYNASLASWNDFPIILDQLLTKEFSYESDLMTEKYLRFKRSRPASEKVILNIDGYYFITQKSFPEVKSGRLNPASILTATRPRGEESVLWDEFVKHRLNCLFVRLDPEGTRLFRGFLKRKYTGGIGALNKISDTRYASFEGIKGGYGELRNSAIFMLYTSLGMESKKPLRMKIE